MLVSLLIIYQSHVALLSLFCSPPLIQEGNPLPSSESLKVIAALGLICNIQVNSQPTTSIAPTGLPLLLLLLLYYCYTTASAITIVILLLPFSEFISTVLIPLPLAAAATAAPCPHPGHMSHHGHHHLGNVYHCIGGQQQREQK